MTARRKGDSVVTGRPGGRPKKGQRPRVPYEEVDKILVFGECVATEDGQSTTIVYPSYRTLALRYGVSNSVIAAYAKKNNCLKRREVARARISAKADDKLVELRAEALALSRNDELRIIDTYLSGFEKALADGTVRFDDPAHFDRFCRLKEFLQGGADSRQEVHAALSLEDLQARHKQMLRQTEDTSVAERGEIARALPAPAQPDGLNPPTAPPAAAATEATGRFAVGTAVGRHGGRFLGSDARPRGDDGDDGDEAEDDAQDGGGAPHGANVAPTGRVARGGGKARRSLPDAKADP